MSNRYRKVTEDGESWVMAPNNGGEVLDLVEELNRQQARIESLKALGGQLLSCTKQLGWTSAEKPDWIRIAIRDWEKAVEP